MDIYDYIENDCQSGQLVVPGYVKMMINKWTTLETKDETNKTRTHIVRSDIRQTKHSTRSTFRSCSPNRCLNQNFGLLNNGNGHPYYIINGTSIHSKHIQKNGQCNKGLISQYDNKLHQNGVENSDQKEDKTQFFNCKKTILANGTNSFTSIKNSNRYSQNSSPNIQLCNSINTNHLNFINKDLNGNSVNKEPNLFLRDTKKLTKNVKENVLKDKFFVNHALSNFLSKDNPEILLHSRSLSNGFDTKKSNVIIYEDREDIKLNENLNSLHPNTPEPLVLSNTVINDELFKEKEDIIAEEIKADKKNGLFYMNVMKQSEIALKSRCANYEQLQDNVPEEVSGRIRSLIGNTHLLTTKKFTQFEKLCESNLKNDANEPSVTNEDLAGFWDLISIQILSIDDSFQELDRLKDNGWKELEETTTNPNISPKKLLIRSTSKTKSESVSTPKKTPENSERTQERKKLIEEKQKLRRAIIDGRTQRKNSNNEDSEIQIFTK